MHKYYQLVKTKRAQSSDSQLCAKEAWKVHIYECMFPTGGLSRTSACVQPLCPLPSTFLPALWYTNRTKDSREESRDGTWLDPTAAKFGMTAGPK